MATAVDIQATLESFQLATETALAALPEVDAFQPPENGITLLDAKNEIFLSYLQALALRNLHVIRSFKAGDSLETTAELNDDLTKKLIEHRVFLERGVRPLEQKMKYQVDRVIKLAHDEAQATARKAAAAKQKAERQVDSAEEDSEADSDGSDSESNDEDLSNLRPNLTSMTTTTTTTNPSANSNHTTNDNIYRPPRISATTMPTTTLDRAPRAERTPRSRTLDEYITTELSTAPTAEPSIGSNLAAGGRSNKTSRQLREEAERREYEETNLVRLPVLSKKERAKKGYAREREGGFGGEEWRDLGRSVDRITEVVRGKGRGREGVLERSRKRAVEDGPRGDGRGEGMGERFEVKKRRLAKKGRI